MSADDLVVDLSLQHYLEARALAYAAEKPATPAERARGAALQARHEALMVNRAAFAATATAQRHARGEHYSAARVAAIQALGPSRETLEQTAQALYADQPDLIHVLMAHARVHFGHPLVSARALLRHYPDDIRAAARAMHRREAAFAAAWIAAVDRDDFRAEMRQQQREALAQLRPPTQPVHLASHPQGAAMTDDVTAALGSAWRALDRAAGAASLTPLSAFLALPDEDAAAGVPAPVLLAAIDALLAALRSAPRKVPGWRRTEGALVAVREVLATCPADTVAWFEPEL